MKSGLPYNTLSLYVAVYIYMLNIYAYARFAFLAVPVCVQNYATCHTCLLHSGTSSIPGSSEAHRAVAMLLNVVQAFVGESVSVCVVPCALLCCRRECRISVWWQLCKLCVIDFQHFSNNCHKEPQQQQQQ